MVKDKTTQCLQRGKIDKYIKTPTLQEEPTNAPDKSLIADGGLQDRFEAP